MGQVHLVVGIQLCLLFMTGILCTRNCKHMGTEFMVLIPPVHGSTNIVIVGPAEITLKPYGQMSIRKTNESPITTSYMVDKPAAAHERLTGSNIRVLSIRATKPVNVYVQSSQGGAFTAVRRPANTLRLGGFLIATTDPGPTCSTYIAVVAYKNDVVINGTVRGKNAEAFFEQMNKTLPNGEEFQNERIKKRGQALLITSSKDLSGSFIQADKPVAVYAGVECDEFGSRVISEAIQIAQIKQLSKFYFSVSIRHDSFTNATFKEIKSNGERRYIGPEAGQTKRSNKPWGLVMQTVHVNMPNTHGIQNVVLQTIFNMNTKLNYSLVAFDGFKTTLLIVQEKCGDCDRSIQLDKVDISRSDSIVLMNTSTTLALQTHVEPGVHFIQSSTAFRLYAYGISHSSVYSYDAPCVCYNFTAKKLTPTTENNTEVSVTTTTGMSSVTTEGDESVVTTARGMSSVTTEGDKSVVITTSRMSSVATEGDESVVTTTSGMSSVTTEGDQSIVTTASGMSSVTTEGDQSVVTTASEMSSVTTEGDESVVTIDRGVSSGTVNVDVTSAKRESGLSSVTTGNDESSVTTEADVSSATTEVDTASVATDPVLLSETSTRSTGSTGQTQAGSPSRPTSAQDTTTPNVMPAGTNTPTLQMRRICPNRSCMCRRVSNTPGIKELKAHLAIDARNVGARFRSKNSIQDNRLLATAIGCIGTFIIFSPLVIIVMLDVRQLFATMMGLNAIEG